MKSSDSRKLPPSPTFMSKVQIVNWQGTQMRLQWNGLEIEIIEIVDSWTELGRWWDQEAISELFMLHTTIGMFLLWKNRDSKDWYAKPIH